MLAGGWQGSTVVREWGQGMRRFATPNARVGSSLGLLKSRESSVGRARPWCARTARLRVRHHLLFGARSTSSGLSGTADASAPRGRITRLLRLHPRANPTSDSVARIRAAADCASTFATERSSRRPGPYSSYTNDAPSGPRPCGWGMLACPACPSHALPVAVDLLIAF